MTPVLPSSEVLDVLAATDVPTSDIGKSGPLGLVLILVLLIATALLVKSMSRHLERLPRSFDPEEADVVVPDTPADLVTARAEPGQEVLDALRRAPLAIEPPRRDDRPDTPQG